MKYNVMLCVLTSLIIHRSNIIIFQVYHLVGMLNHSTGGGGREGGVEEERIGRTEGYEKKSPFSTHRNMYMNAPC